MGIDGIEFHPGYHQNLGTFQELWIFRMLLLSQISPPPLGQITYKKILYEIHFWNTSGTGGILVMNTIVSGIA